MSFNWKKCLNFLKKSSQDVPKMSPKLSQNFNKKILKNPKCSKNVPKCSQNSPKSVQKMQKCSKQTKCCQKNVKKTKL